MRTKDAKPRIRWGRSHNGVLESTDGRWRIEPADPRAWGTGRNGDGWVRLLDHGRAVMSGGLDWWGWRHATAKQAAGRVLDGTFSYVSRRDDAASAEETER